MQARYAIDKVLMTLADGSASTDQVETICETLAPFSSQQIQPKEDAII